MDGIGDGNNNNPESIGPPEKKKVVSEMLTNLDIPCSPAGIHP
jgi:hypothetical protein